MPTTKSYCVWCHTLNSHLGCRQNLHWYQYFQKRWSVTVEYVNALQPSYSPTEVNVIITKRHSKAFWEGQCPQILEWIDNLKYLIMKMNYLKMYWRLLKTTLVHFIHSEWNEKVVREFTLWLCLCRIAELVTLTKGIEGKVKTAFGKTEGKNSEEDCGRCNPSPLTSECLCCPCHKRI